MKISDGAVNRARAVLAAWGPLPPDEVIRKALEAALGPMPDPASRARKRRNRKEREAGVTAQELRAAQREAARNQRLVEAGETFASRKPSDFRRR